MSNNEIDLNEKIISEQDHVKELISGELPEESTRKVDIKYVSYKELKI